MKAEEVKCPHCQQKVVIFENRGKYCIHCGCNLAKDEFNKSQVCVFLQIDSAILDWLVSVNLPQSPFSDVFV